MLFRSMLVRTSLIWCSAVCVAAVWRNYEIVLSNMLCGNRSASVKYLECSVSRSANNRTSLNMKLATLRDVYITQVIITSTVDFKDNHLNLPATQLSECGIGAKKTGLLARILKNQLIRPDISNMGDMCPLSKNCDYFLRNLTLKSEELPPFTPMAKFRAHIRAMENASVVIDIQVDGEAVSKANKRHNRRLEFLVGST